MHLFFALTAALGMTTLSADATNAYANSPPPETPTFVRIDDAYADWYRDKYGKEIDRNLVLPVLQALQGHLLEGHYINTLLAKFGFQSTTHEKSIYSTTIDGKKVLLCRQVDDLAVACDDPAVCKMIIEELATKISLTDDLLMTSFNGVDVVQT